MSPGNRARRPSALLKSWRPAVRHSRLCRIVPVPRLGTAQRARTKAAAIHTDMYVCVLCRSLADGRVRAHTDAEIEADCLRRQCLMRVMQLGQQLRPPRA